MSVPELLAIAVAALGGTRRRGQQEMAAAVAHAFETGEHLVVQAGTGTGKSLAYLVPAIIRALCDDAPVVVSTATIALHTARYGEFLRASLPPFWQTTNATQVRAALRRLARADAKAH